MMQTYIRNQHEIGTPKVITEYLDGEHEWTYHYRGEVLESGTSSCTLADGKELSQSIDILRTKNYGILLFLDNLLQTSDIPELEAPYHETMVHVPLIEHPHPRRVLVLGGGDGAIVREVLKHEGVEECVLIELDPNVVEVCTQHLPNCARAFLEHDPRLRIQYEDCIGYLKAIRGTSTYDVVIIDLTDIVNVEQEVVRNTLYSSDLYRLVSGVMQEHGIMMTYTGRLWLETDDAVNAEIYNNIVSIFPHTTLLCTFVPMFTLEWLFCMACKNQEHQWNQLDQKQSARQQIISRDTIVYERDFHRMALCSSRRVQQHMRNVTG